MGKHIHIMQSLKTSNTVMFKTNTEIYTLCVCVQQQYLGFYPQNIQKRWLIISGPVADSVISSWNMVKLHETSVQLANMYSDVHWNLIFILLNIYVVMTALVCGSNLTFKVYLNGVISNSTSHQNVRQAWYTAQEETSTTHTGASLNVPQAGESKPSPQRL